MSEDDRARLRAEEIFRSEIRGEIEAGRTSSRKRFLAVANSPFCLWLLSTVVVGLGTFLYSRWDDSRQEARRVRPLVSRLDLEISFRLRQLEKRHEAAWRQDVMRHLLAGHLQLADFAMIDATRRYTVLGPEGNTLGLNGMCYLMRDIALQLAPEDKISMIRNANIGPWSGNIREVIAALEGAGFPKVDQSGLPIGDDELSRDEVVTLWSRFASAFFSDQRAMSALKTALDRAVVRSAAFSLSARAAGLFDEFRSVSTQSLLAQLQSCLDGSQRDEVIAASVACSGFIALAENDAPPSEAIAALDEALTKELALDRWNAYRTNPNGTPLR